MWRGAVIFLAMCLMWQPAPAMGARLALLIANQKYTSNVGPLKNPHNDVVLVHKALVSIGFRPQDITVVLDAGRTKIRYAVRRYADRLAKAGEGAIGFFYYSGHGAAEMASRTNYLIPVDVIDVGDALWDESVRLSYVIDRLQLRAPKAAHFVVFDACRNELRLRGTKALEKGFVPVTARRGMLIGYSTDLGQTASDEGPQSGPYAAALAAELGRSGRRAGILFDDIKFRVYRNTNEKQLPWHISKFTTPIFLAAKVPPPVSKPTSAPTPVVARPPVSEAARAWNVTKDTTSTAVLRAFIKLYKDSVFSELARVRVKELEAQAKTKRPKVALLPPASRPAVPAGAAVPTTPQGLAEVLQSELKRVGCYHGRIDGDWGPGSRSAMLAFNQLTSSVLDSLEPTLAAIEVVRQKKKRVCSTNIVRPRTKKSPDTKKKKGSSFGTRPNPSRYSFQVWPAYNLGRKRRTLRTKHGLLVCTAGSRQLGTRRQCSWQ